MDSALAPLFLKHSADKLRQMTAAIDSSFSKLSNEQIWKRNGSNENALGNLVLHLCGNLGQWINHTLGGEADVRDRPKEFALDAQASREDLLGMLKASVDQAVTVIQSLDAERLASQVITQDGPRTGLEVVYQVVGHFQQHAGQIIFATKQFTGEDLALYKPAAR